MSSPITQTVGAASTTTRSCRVPILNCGRIRHVHGKRLDQSPGLGVVNAGNVEFFDGGVAISNCTADPSRLGAATA